MSDDGAWFAPARYGYGAGLPIRWQGWALLITFMILIGGTGLAIGDRWWFVPAVVLPLTFLLLAIVMRKTRGGWRWRWGGED